MERLSAIELVIYRLKEFKRKYYLNLLVRGSIFSLAIIAVLFLILNSLEYTLRFSSPIRTFLFFLFIVLFCCVLIWWVVKPVINLFNNRKQISNEEAAQQIGKHFPDIKDKLLNTIQLNKSNPHNNELIAASIKQRSSQLAIIPFSDAINIKENKKYAHFLIIPFSIIFLVLLFVPQFFTESTSRIVRYNTEFIPEAPFKFILKNKDLKAFKNEDFTVLLSFSGDAVPNQAYLSSHGRRVKMKKNSNDEFEYSFQKLQATTKFSFEAAGFISNKYQLTVINRPVLKDFIVNLNYPAYLKKENEILENIGNFQLPEGTNVNWIFNTLDSDSLSVEFKNSGEKHNVEPSEYQLFEFTKKIVKPENYILTLKNRFSKNKEDINYFIEVVQDQFPQINLQQFRDTLFYNSIVLGGNISDDYGITDLKLFYKLESDDKTNKFTPVIIPFNKDQNSQSYYYKWDIQNLNLKQGDKIEYYVQVWDNDGVNGHKSSKTGLYSLNLPSKTELKEDMEKSSEKAKDDIAKSLQQSQELQKQLEDAENKILGKKNLTWQDEKMIENLLQKRNELNEQIEKLKEQHRENLQKQEKFGEKDEKLKEKVEQLQKLMDELLDEETKKLYDELQRLLQEQKDIDKIQNVLEKLDKKEENLHKELERTLELFKRWKFENKLDETIKETQTLNEKQENLAEETKEKKNDNAELSKEQKKLNEEFKELQKDINELQQLNQNLKNPDPMQNTSEEEQKIEQEQQKSQENLNNGNKKDAQKAQKKASEELKKLGDKLESMQSSMEMSMLQQNLEHLRHIVDDLVKLSFEEENLMKDFRKINQSDPRYIELSQKQLKMKDDAKIIEDSLLSLAKQVFQIASFVTREVGDMNQYMDESLQALKDRKQALAISKQQFAMTSMNNLSLLLNDILKQMQQQMNDAMGKPNSNSKSGKNNPSLSQMQQELNNKIQELKKSGSSGRALSEELAKLAAEQERLRQALKEMEGKAGDGEMEGGSGKKMKEISKKMEETEADLVNKKITETTINRQKEILTRLLEAEKSARERELDEKREAERPENFERHIPKAFSDYIKAKEKEIELLKTVPPVLNPYYKKEVNNYFQRIETKN